MPILTKTSIRRARDIGALLVLGTCAGFASLQHLWDTKTLNWFEDTSANITSLRTIAAQLRSLDVTGDEAGYISQADTDPETTAYYELQYALAPTILVRSPAPALVICHMPDRALLLTKLAQNHLVLVGGAGANFYVARHQRK